MQKLFKAYNNPDDPLLHIREPVDVLELAKKALATSAAEVYKAQHDGLVEQCTLPDNNAPLAQPDQGDDAPAQLPPLEDVAEYFQHIVDSEPEPPDPDPQAQDPDAELQDVGFAASDNENWLDLVNQLVDDGVAAQVPEDPVRPAEDHDAEATAEPDEEWRSFVNWGANENQDAEPPAEPQPVEPAPDDTGNPTDQDDDLNHPVVQAVPCNPAPFGLTF